MIHLVSQKRGLYKSSKRSISAVPCVSLVHNIIDLILTANPDYNGAHHCDYTLEYHRLLPFLQLPRIKSVHTLTADFLPFHDFSPWYRQRYENSSNATNLTYDECALEPYAVMNSLWMFRSLETFRWTLAAPYNELKDRFVGFQSAFGKALFAHKDTLEELYLDCRHPQVLQRPSKFEGEADSILIGSFEQYPKLKKLAIDELFLLGNQDWKS